MSWWPWRTSVATPSVNVSGDVHGTILIGSDNSVTQIRAERAVGGGVRHTLQSPGGDLVDRVEELEQLRMPVSGAAPEVRAVVGMGGVGKSVLARLAAHHLKGRFPDVQYELDLLGHTHGAAPLTPNAALERLMSWAAIETDPADDLETRAGAWRNWLRGKKALLLLDNASSIEQVECLLPGYGECLVLITSRHYLDDPRITSISLGGLSETDATELLANRRRNAGQMPAVRSDVLSEICRACGNIPAVVNSAAALLSDYTDPAELLTDMVSAGRPLEGLPTADEAVRRTFHLSYQALTHDQKRFLGLLALHPGRDFTVNLAAALSGVPRHEARRRIGELRDRHLLEPMSEGRYGFHDIYLASARDQAPGDDMTRSAVLHRISAQLGGDAVEARDTLIRAASDEETRKARSWISAEHQNLVAVTLAAAGMREPYAWELADITSLLCAWLGFRSVNADVWRNMLSMAQTDDDRQGQARALRGLADVSRVQGRYDEAVDAYTRSSEIFRDLDDGRGEAASWWGLGEIHRAQSRLEAATDAYTRAKVLYESEGDRPGAANALWGIGNVLLFEGRYPESRTVFGEVRTAFQQIADRQGEAQAIRGLADVERMLEHREAARDLYTLALAIYQDVGDLRGQAGCLRGLGHLDRLQGRLEAAVAGFTQALELAEELGDLRVQANMLRGLGDTERQRGRYDEARRALARSIELNQRLRNKAGLGWALRVLADIEREQGRFPEARQAYENSLAAFRAGRREVKGVADALSGFAELALEEQDPEEARRHLGHALHIYENLGITKSAADCRARLGGLPPERSSPRGP